MKNAIMEIACSKFARARRREDAPPGRITAAERESGSAPGVSDNSLLYSTDLKGLKLVVRIYVRGRSWLCEEIEKLLGVAAGQALNPRIHATFPFERCVVALETLASRTVVGKCLIDFD